MGSDRSDLKSIALEYLFDGMKLTEDIYNFNGTMLLLARGSILTANRIKQLKQYNDNNRNISVFDRTYFTLIGHGLPSDSSLVRQHLEDMAGYTNVKNQTAELLEQTKATGLSKSYADQIRENISETLNVFDPSIIFQCINAPNPIDEYLQRHSINVSLLNGLIGKWLGLEAEDIELLILTGLVHDVGKTKIPIEILNAPRRLSPREFATIRQHPIFSYELLDMDERFPVSVKLAVKYHHEKMNGSGYPEGLIAEEIPLFARITSVSDIYDAMISKRVYKEAHNPFTVIADLTRQQFSKLDIQLVKLFTNNMPQELIGKAVLLSDGSIGTVRYIIPEDLEHPFIEINGRVEKTSSSLYCERMAPEN